MRTRDNVFIFLNINNFSNYKLISKFDDIIAKCDLDYKNSLPKTKDKVIKIAINYIHILSKHYFEVF